jgi:BMFP domain-containing protein YqiC
VRYIDVRVTLIGLEQFMADNHSAKRSGSSLFERLTRTDDPVFEQIDRNAKSLLQSALTRLDVVSREEFDAQTAVLKRTRERLEALEAQIAALDETLSATGQQGDQ